MAWKDIVKSVKSGADAVTSVAVFADKDGGSNKNGTVNNVPNDIVNDVDISTGAEEGASQSSHANDLSKSPMAGLEHYMDKIKNAWPFDKESPDVSFDSNDSGKEHSATVSEAFDNAANGTGTLADAVKAAKESQVQDEPGTLGAIKEKIGSVGDMMKDKAVNAVDSVKEHVGRVVDFAPEEPTNDSDSGYDLG